MIETDTNNMYVSPFAEDSDLGLLNKDNVSGGAQTMEPVDLGSFNANPDNNTNNSPHMDVLETPSVDIFSYVPDYSHLNSGEKENAMEPEIKEEVSPVFDNPVPTIPTYEEPIHEEIIPENNASIFEPTPVIDITETLTAEKTVAPVVEPQINNQEYDAAAMDEEIRALDQGNEELAQRISKREQDLESIIAQNKAIMASNIATSEEIKVLARKLREEGIRKRKEERARLEAQLAEIEEKYTNASSQTAEIQEMLAKNQATLAQLQASYEKLGASKEDLGQSIVLRPAA